MIDEDLYQQATDELNSDKRRPHIWARACALASDDHDEARYLYTNLRVEELIAQREANGPQPIAPVSSDIDDDFETPLTLEPIELEDADIPESISAPSGVDQIHSPDDLLSLNAASLEDEDPLSTIERTSFQEKFDNSSDLDDLAEQPVQRDEEQTEIAFGDDYLDETINLTSELDGTAVYELDSDDVSEFDGDELFDTSDLLADDLNNPEDTGELLAKAALLRAAPVASASHSDTAEDDELEALLGGVYQGSEPPAPKDPLADDDTDDDIDAALTVDFSDVTGTQTVLDDSSEWLEGELEAEENQKELQQYSPSTAADKPIDDTDRLAMELERQANDLPGQRDDIVSASDEDDDLFVLTDNAPAIDSGDTFDEEAERDISESLKQKYADTDAAKLDDEDTRSPGREQNNELAAAAALAATGTIADNSSTSAVSRELPVDLSDQGSGTLYSIYRRDEQAQAVKNGVSWPALFLTLPYLIYRHLFGTALVYALMWLILVAGLLVAGLSWLDAGNTVSAAVKSGTVGFALLSLIGLLYLPFRYANQWREDKLEQRGFELVAWVRAKTPGKAIAAARRAATLD